MHLGLRGGGVRGEVGQLSSFSGFQQPGFWLLLSARRCSSLEYLLSAYHMLGATRI